MKQSFDNPTSLYKRYERDGARELNLLCLPLCIIVCKPNSFPLSLVSTLLCSPESFCSLWLPAETSMATNDSWSDFEVWVVNLISYVTKLLL